MLDQRTATAAPLNVALPPIPARRRSSRLWRSLKSRRTVFFGFLVLGVVVFWARAAPFISPHQPRAGNVIDSKIPPLWLPQGDRRFLLGTDELGRDILTRVIYGSQISLVVGFSAVALAGAVGVTLGLFSGYRRGRVDDVIMRLADIQLALPQILMAIALLAVLRPGLRNVILTLAITNRVTYARLVPRPVLSC